MNQNALKKMHSDCIASIIIPAYNEELYLPNCLGSIKKALSYLITENLVELVIIDNNSTDSTHQICELWSNKIPNTHLIFEDKLGPGYARFSGVNHVLIRESQRTHKSQSAFWIINTDADTLVPHLWLKSWLEYINKTTSSIVAGNGIFDKNFSKNYPNSTRIFSTIGQQIKKIEKIFGTINADGFNSAIEKHSYETAGPYNQPTHNLANEQEFNVAGEDWDLSTRARVKGVKIERKSNYPVISSSRRFEQDAAEYIDGTAYEKPFSKVINENKTKDIEEETIERHLFLAAKRQSMHYVLKPILADKNILNDEKVQNFLGTNLVSFIIDWTMNNKIPDFFDNREKFIFEYLNNLHKIVGDDLGRKLLSL